MTIYQSGVFLLPCSFDYTRLLVKFLCRVARHQSTSSNYLATNDFTQHVDTIPKANKRLVHLYATPAKVSWVCVCIGVTIKIQIPISIYKSDPSILMVQLVFGLIESCDGSKTDSHGFPYISKSLVVPTGGIGPASLG
jgi:hypothetical protein